MSELYDELTDIERRLRKLDKKIRQLCQQNENCQRILKASGDTEYMTATQTYEVHQKSTLKRG